MASPFGFDNNPAKLAYDAYCDATGGVSLVTGDRLPAWDVLPERIRLAWEAAADAVKAWCEERMPYRD